jgi:hypothetical protein
VEPVALRPGFELRLPPILGAAAFRVEPVGNYRLYPEAWGLASVPGQQGSFVRVDIGIPRKLRAQRTNLNLVKQILS